MDTIRWGMIGCGAVTEQKSGPGFALADGSALVAVMSRTKEKAEDWARRHRVPRAYDSAEALLADEEVDAVYVATHPDTHLHYTLMAAELGKPVYCEKPLGRSWEESRRMVEFCKARNVPLFSAYYRRSLRKYQTVKDMVMSGFLGPVRAVHVQMFQKLSEADSRDGGTWRVRPEISGGGMFHDVGSHALDLIDWIVGPITAARGIGMNQSGAYRADDVVTGHFTTEGGVVGTGLFVFNTFKDEDVTTIYCEGGSLSYSVLDIAAPIVMTSERGGVEMIEMPTPPKHVAGPLIQSVVNELLGRGTCPSSGESGARTDWVIEQMLKGS